MWYINFLPAMRYVPTQKVRALFFLSRLNPSHSHQGLRVGALGGNIQKRNSPRKEFPKLSLGDLRNGDDNSLKKRNRVPEESGIPQNGALKKGEPKTGMHNLG